jgi:hypothetical protein
MVTSLVITYLLLAPADAPISGFGLGSIGLAIKMVILQFVTVNVAAFYLALSMREKFDWLYQPQSILFCLCSGLFAYTISNSVSVISGNVWAGLTIAAILHSLLLLALIWLMPSIAGLDRSDFQKIICNLLGTKISHGAE